MTHNDNTLVNFIDLNYDQSAMILRWRNARAIRSNMFNDHIITGEEHALYLDKLKSDVTRVNWLVINAVHGNLGVIYLDRISKEHRGAYLGIYANPENKIYHAGSILMESLLDMAFVIMQLHTLKLEVLSSNELAVNFYKKYKFKDEGILREYIWRDNKWIDVIIMGLTEGEYGENKNKK